MPHSYCNLIYHLVFSTIDHHPWMDAEVCARLHPFLGGLIRQTGGTALQVGGTDDHVHILARLRQDKALSDILREVKALSSGWVHRTFPQLRDFAWQSGYGAFTVSESQVQRVRRYIQNQVEHHRRCTFQEEFLALLKAHSIPYDERYIWK